MKDAIAIVGMGCRFPQANSPDAFWEILRDGREAVVPVPQDRWDIEAFYDPSPETPGKMSTRWGAFLEQVDGFDAEFFGLSADEIEHVDPQQRLFLEVAWEALEQGGILPRSLAGTQTGVFIGLCTVDYHRLLYKSFDRIGPHSGTGTTMCIAANRLSYLLDLRGPSIAIDAACSSSLVTVHLACQSLRTHESDLCIAGGVNLILSPDSTISSSQTRLLSNTGRCRPFDARADGYVRGEGCGVVVLKRLTDARRDGDNILALVRGSAVNQDGLSNSLTAPNGLAQQAVIRRALDNSGVQPHEISYVDAHAVGTPLGDAIEFKALTSVLTEGRDADRPCWIGSAKPNIGHLEAASGMAALIKVILSLQHELIPAHLHLNQINPYISFKDASIAIPTEPQPWPKGDQHRLAGISAFGFGGTNTHVVIQEAPAIRSLPAVKEERPCHLLTLSAKTANALGELVQKYDTLLATSPDLSLADLCFTTNAGRTPFEHRLCIVTETLSQLRQQLRAFNQQQPMSGVFSATIRRRKLSKVAFLFPEVGSELWVLGRQLYSTQPTFRHAFERCDRLLPTVSLATSLFATDSADPWVSFAIQYSLAELLQTWGIQPKAVVGIGLGATAAVCIAGELSLDNALKQVCSVQVIDPKGSEDSSLQRFPIKFIPQLSAEDLSGYDVLLSLGGTMNLPAPLDEQQIGLDSTGWPGLLTVLAQLYLKGVKIDWMGCDRDYPRRRLSLPTYPFQRQRYWFKTDEPALAAPKSSLSPPKKISSLLRHLQEQHSFSDAQLAVLPQLLNALKADLLEENDSEELLHIVTKESIPSNAPPISNLSQEEHKAPNIEDLGSSERIAS